MSNVIRQEQDLIERLKQNECCRIAIREQKVYLNEHDISEQKNEFIKILVISSKKLTNIISQQSELINKALEFLKYQPTKSLRSNSNNNDEDENDSNSNSDSFSYSNDTSQQSQSNESDEDISQEIKDQLETIEDSILEELHTTHLKIDDTELQTKINEIHQTYYQIIINLLDGNSQEEEQSFISPFFIKNIKNSVKLSGQIEQYFSANSEICQACLEKEQLTIQQLGQTLKAQNIHLSFDKFVVNLAHTVYCGHEQALKPQQKAKKNTQSASINIKTENITCKHLQIVGHKDDFIAQSKLSHVSFEVDSTIQVVTLESKILQYINFNCIGQAFICKLKIQGDISNSFKQNITKIKQIPLAEVQLSIQQRTPFNQLSQLNKFNCLLYLDNQLKYFKTNQLVSNLFKQKYSLMCSLYCFHKLFGSDFSFLRVMYDLHELIDE